MVYVFLADGFEEIEALAPVDMLRRAEANVKTVRVGGIARPQQSKFMKKITEALSEEHPKYKNEVTSARNIKIIADIHESEINLDNLEMIILPGGAAGVENLYKSEKLREIIEYCVRNNIKIGAICAAPSILARLGYLKNMKATAYPTFQHYLADNGARLSEEKVITDGLFTTAAGAGVSLEFALELVRVLKGEEPAIKIGEQILL